MKRNLSIFLILLSFFFGLMKAHAENGPKSSGDIGWHIDQGSICGESKKTIEALTRFFLEVSYLEGLMGKSRIEINSWVNVDALRTHQNAIDDLKAKLPNKVIGFYVLSDAQSDRVDVTTEQKVYRLSFKHLGQRNILYKRDARLEYGEIEVDLQTCGASTLSKKEYDSLRQIINWSYNDQKRIISLRDADRVHELFSCSDSEKNPNFMLGKSIDEINLSFSRNGINIVSATKSVNLAGFNYEFIWTSHLTPRVAAVKITKTGAWDTQSVQGEILHYDHDAAILRDPSQIIGNTGNDRNIINNPIQKVSQNCVIGIGFYDNSKTLVIWSDALVKTYRVDFDRSKVRYNFHDNNRTQFMILGNKIVGKKDFDEAMTVNRKK